MGCITSSLSQSSHHLRPSQWVAWAIKVRHGVMSVYDAITTYLCCKCNLIVNIVLCTFRDSSYKLVQQCPT